MTQVTVAQGIHGSGGRLYDWRQLAAVRAAVLATARGQALTVESIVDATGIHGRTIRQILSDIDGLDFLLGGTDGYFVCEYADESFGLTHMLQSQVETMHRRLARRTAFAPRLPLLQGRLW